MTDVDLSRVIRLREAVRSILESIPDRPNVGELALVIGGLPVAYANLRNEASNLVPEDTRAEFNRLFPSVQPRPADYMNDVPIVTVGRGSEARTLLAQLGGWLDGFIVKARMQSEIDAYARERVKAERGVGFS
jgi:hypothetical protein